MFMKKEMMMKMKMIQQGLSVKFVIKMVAQLRHLCIVIVCPQKNGKMVSIFVNLALIKKMEDINLKSFKEK